MQKSGAAQRRAYMRRYQASHRDRIKELQKKWYTKNKDRMAQYLKEYHKQHQRPRWMKTLSQIKQRCNNPRCPDYKYYGYLGVQCKLTKIGIKKLWFRYGADKMKRPVIHRIDTWGHYERRNCKFMEKVDHDQLHYKNRSKCRQILDGVTACRS